MSSDPVTSYAKDVVEGRIVAGRLVRLACARHLRDLEEGPARGLTWDVEAVNRVISFFSHLRLPVDGELDGKPFKLEPFQQFIQGSLFGWKVADGSRRFRTAYIEMGKGNGKTPQAAGTGLYGLVADNEAAAEIYNAATAYKQADIGFRDAKRMAQATPALRKILEIHANNIGFPRNGSFMRPTSAERRGLDGPRPHMALIDEIQEHPDSNVVDKLRAGTKGRRQSLIFEITNSGYDRTTICWHHHEYSIKVLEGAVENDSWFAYVCQLDVCEKCRAEGQDQPKEDCPTCDDWRDEKVWPKANPGLGTILPIKYLREQVAEAKGMPTKEGVVKRLSFCIWTQGLTKAIPLDRWSACTKPIGRAALKGRACYGGLDIGATSDFTAFVLDFPDYPTAGLVTLLCFFWLPATPVRRDEKMQQMIDLWRQQGHIRTTPGEVVDYDQVLRDIVELADEFHIHECGFDRGFQGAQIGNNLMSHFGDQWLVTVPQGVLSMNAPFRDLVERTVQGRLQHDGQPVMQWMVSNCVAEERGGLSKPSKEHSTEKIDGVTAACMARARAMLADESGPLVEVW